MKVQKQTANSVKYLYLFSTYITKLANSEPANRLISIIKSVQDVIRSTSQARKWSANRLEQLSANATFIALGIRYVECCSILTPRLNIISAAYLVDAVAVQEPIKFFSQLILQLREARRIFPIFLKLDLLSKF